MLQKTILKYKTIVHSIPIGSMLALLLCSLCLFNSQLFSNDNDVYAIEEENMYNSSNDESNSKTTYTNNTNLSTRANTITPTATLSIDGNTNSNINGTTYSNPGDTVYLTHNVDVNVNDVVGYNLSISYGADANNTLNYEGSSKTPPTITGANGVVGNNLVDNTWGYHWDTNSTSSNDDNSNNTESLGQLSYNTMPDYNNSNTILTESNSTNTAYNKTINGKLIFAAKFSEDAPYGHYKTSVLLSLAATPQTITTYTITYNCNGRNNCPENVSENSTDLTYTYTIPNLTPEKEGYTFLGYSTSSTNNTVEYSPNSTISLSSASPSVTLYVIWQQNITPTTPITDWNKLEYMQQMTPEACSQATIATDSNYNSVQKFLTDSRDNKRYLVRKLDDERCWMIYNLQLDISKANSLSGKNTNLAAETTTWPAQDLTAGGFTKDSTNPYWNNGTGVNTNKPWNSDYGYYYNWCAATAGQGRYCTNATTSNNNSEYSICPKGWKLPTKAEYDNLLSQARIT